MKKIKIAQIGTGHDHAADIISVLKKKDAFDLVGYCRVPEDEKNLPEFSYEGYKARYDGIRELSLEEILHDDDLQAVCIETEDRALTKYALLAAKQGLHIHMDKPGGIVSGDFDRLIQTVKSEKLVFHTGYMYRYNPAVLKLKEDIDAGKLGTILSVEAQMSCLHGRNKRDWMADYPGGMLCFLGCHMVDLIYSIMGTPEEIIPLSCNTKADGNISQDYGMAIFRYRNGVSFAKSCALEPGGFDRRQLVVTGTKGMVEIRPLEAGALDEHIFVPLVSRVREVFLTDSGVAENNYTTEVFGRYDAMMQSFADCVSEKRVNPFDYHYEQELHRILLKACGC